MIERVLKFWPAFAALICLYVAAIIASGLGWNPTGEAWNFQNSGAFGDSFGPLNALVATVAAVGAVAAYRAQREELDRIKETAPIERAEGIKRDFETTFFNLLKLFRDTVTEIDVPDRYGNKPKMGRDALRRILDEYVSHYKSKFDDRGAFRHTYFRFRDDLGHYFRLFYNILRFIDDAHVEDKLFYVRLLRATLSDAEIVLIALNCMYGGGGKLKPYVERYALLHNISKTSAEQWQIRAGFNAAAFGDRSFSESDEIA